LLASALEVLAEGRSPSLREVARRAGASPAAVYHHFADKHALLSAVAEEGFVSLRAALEAIDPDDPVERLRRMAGTYVHFAVHHAAHYQVMFDPQLEPGTSGGGEPSALEQAARATFAVLVEAMTGVMAEHEGTGRAAIRRRSVLAWSLAHGAAQLALGGLTVQLDPGLDLDVIAREVGHAVVDLAEGPTQTR